MAVEFGIGRISHQKATLGSNCSIGQNVFIADNVTIGNNVKIQNNVSLYDGVILEDDVFVQMSMVFTNVRYPRSQFCKRDQFSKTIVKKGTTIGANATIVCGITLGSYSFVGAGSLVTKDFPDFSLITGVPGKHTGWVSRYGEKLDIKFGRTGFCKSKYNNDQYRICSTSCELLKNI